MEGICLSSGGIKLFLHLGALDYFYEKNLLQDVKYYSGCSAGSLVCALLCIGYTPKEILVYMCKNDYVECFSNISPLCLINKYGLIDTTKAKIYLENMIIQKFGYVPTFQELYNTTNKVLYCATCRINKEYIKKEYLSKYSNPNMSILNGILASCSIPILFSRYEINNDIYIDGAVFDKIPLKPLVKKGLKNIIIISFEIDNKINDIDSILGYFKTLTSILIRNELKYKEYEKCHYKIKYDNISQYSFNLTKNDRIKMFIDSKEQVYKLYLKKNKVKND